jgi:ATP synthase protein I
MAACCPRGCWLYYPPNFVVLLSLLELERIQTGESKDLVSKKNKGPGLLLISVGTILSSMVVAGFLLGYGLDVWLDTKPFLMMALGVMGFVGGILKVYKLLNDPNLQ